MGGFRHQDFESLPVLLVVDHRSARARFVNNPLQAVGFPSLDPDADGVTPDTENLADLIDGVLIVAEQNGMSPTAQYRLFAVQTGFVQRLDIGRRKS